MFNLRSYQKLKKIVSDGEVIGKKEVASQEMVSGKIKACIQRVKHIIDYQYLVLY